MDTIGEVGSMFSFSILLHVAVCAQAESEEEAPLAAPPPNDFLAQEFDFDAARVPASLPAWAGSQAQCDLMVADGVSWAACNGLMMRTPPGEAEDAPPTYVHAPFSLGPCQYPAASLREAYEIAPLFGKLVEEVSKDVPWLASTLATTAESDDFTKRLLKLCARVQAEGKTQSARLAILRSDYMLHEPAEGGQTPQLLQVELNTIASSFGGLSQRVAAMHTQLAQRWPSVRRHAWEAAAKPGRLTLPESLPPNPAADGIAEGLARAHALYGDAEASILFVVQPEERNHIDQEHVVQQLWRAHGIRVICRTLAQVCNRLEFATASYAEPPECGRQAERGPECSPAARCDN